MPASPPIDLQAPYAGLGPDRVLDALAAVGLHGDGRLLQLNSYENRVYQVYLEDGRVVVAKFYRPGRWTDAQILEEHGFAAALGAAEIPVAVPWTLQPAPDHRGRLRVLGATLAAWDDAVREDRFAVAAKLPGRAPELDAPDQLAWLGRYIARIHAVGAVQPFRERLTLSVDSFGVAARDWLLAHDIPAPDAVAGWRAAVDTALELAAAAFDGIAGLRALRLHGDCHLGNILWADDGPCFVDLDDAVNGPAVQDLWMLLAGDRAAMQRQLGAVLDGYEQFMPFDRRELALVEPLRTLRMLHHSAWIARRWDDPAFPIAFPWFASPSYWAQETIRLNEQIDAMRAPPLVA